MDSFVFPLFLSVVTPWSYGVEIEKLPYISYLDVQPYLSVYIYPWNYGDLLASQW